MIDFLHRVRPNRAKKQERLEGRKEGRREEGKEGKRRSLLTAGGGEGEKVF
jgi:hypothetical protein